VTQRLPAWHLSHSGGVWRYGALGAPWRWDLCAQTYLPLPPLGRGPAGWLCQQIRQDVWRALQGVRGFSPMVELCADQTGLRVMAGGVLRSGGAVTQRTQTQLDTVLNAPGRKARWTAQTRRSLPDGHKSPAP